MDIVEDFVLDKLDVGLEGLLREAKLDKLFLLHKLGVGAIVYDIATEDRNCKGTVDLFGVGVLESAVEDKVVAFDSEAADNLAAKEDKGEDVAVLEKRQTNSQ
jgi:hypothetical protein